MSSDSFNPSSNNHNNNNNKPPSPPPADMHRNRRGSVTSAAFTNLFQRSNSTATGTPVFPSAITSAALNEQRRRQSLTTASLGLSGTSPTSNASFARRASLSTNNSDSLDENAIEEEDYPFTSRTVNPFTRRMSVGASTAMRRPGGNSPGAGNESQGFNWSEQLRSRAESTVASGQRPSFSLASGLNGSPPRTGAMGPGTHDRAKSISEMPVPPAQAPKSRSPPRDSRPKPDHFQERILKGDFYMD